MEASQRTIESIYNDQDLVDAMWHSDKALGNEVAYGDNKAIVDNFLENNRWRDINLGSIINASSKVEDMNDDQKVLFAHALKEIEKLPWAGADGGADLWDAALDYTGAALADPSNLASIIAGGFTFGTAGVAAFGAKEAAKQAAKAGIRARLKAVLGKPALKAYGTSLAVDGSIAGAGGAYHSLEKQGMEKDLNLIDEVDPLRALTQGALEGIASPLVGIAGTAGAKGLGKVAGKVADKVVPQQVTDAAVQGKDFMARYLLPTAGVSEMQRRLIERPTGEMLLLKEDADILYKNFTKAIEANPRLNSEQGKALVNKALEGDKKAMSALRKEDATAADLLDASRIKIKEAQDFADEAALSKEIKGLFNTKKDYVRNIYDVYTTQKRSVPFKKFVADNPDVLQKLKLQVRKNPKSRLWRNLAQDYINLDTKKIIPEEAGNEDAIITKIAKTLYTPTIKLRKETAPLLKKRIRALDQEKISPLVRKIMGQNNDPALRVLESVNGLIESAARTNAIRNIAYDSVRNNYGHISKARTYDAAHAEAVKKLGPDIMRLVGVAKDADHKKLAKDKTVTNLEDDVIEEGLKYTFVTRKEGEKLKMLLDETSRFNEEGILGGIARTLSGLQGFSKGGKTLYSPIAMGRNILGAAGYTIAGGNTRGIINALSNSYRKLSKKERTLLEEEFINSGLKGSNIDLNQAMKRLGDISNRENNQSFWTDGDIHSLTGMKMKAANFARSGGLSVFGDRGARLAGRMREFYAAGDDVFKYGTFVNEKNKAKKVFDKYSKQRQNEILDKFQKDFFFDPKVKNKKQARQLLENAYLKEEAARTTANITPVYDRVPKLLEMMRAIPIIGSFTAYPAERIRNRYNIMKLASEEVSRGAAEGNWQLARQGMHRLASFGTMVGGLHAGTHLWNKFNGFVGEEETLRKNAPEYDKDGALLITGKDKDDTIRYHNLNYIHPDSDMLDAVMPIMLKAFRGEDVSENLGEAVKNSFLGLIKPYVQPSLALQFADEMWDYVQTGEDYSFKNALKTIEPGYANIIRDLTYHSGGMSLGAEEMLYPSRFGVPSEKAEGLGDYLNKAGLGTVPFVKEKTFNPKLGLAFALKEVARNVSEEDKDFSSNLKTMLENTARSTPENVMATDKKILEEYAELLQVKYEEQRALAKIIENLDGVMNKNQIRRFLKYQGKTAKTGLSNDVIEAAMRGRSYGKGKGYGNDSFWKNINETLSDRTGLRYDMRMRYLRDNMRDIETLFHNKNLLEETPEIEIYVKE